MKENNTGLKKNISQKLFGVIFCSLMMLSAKTYCAGNHELHGYIIAAAIPHAQLVGHLPDTTHLNLQIGLPLRNENILDSLNKDIYNPLSSNYRHYLTPDQFTKIFGPTEQDYHSVINFMEANGLTVTATYPGRIVLDVNGTVSNIEKIFHVILNVYQNATDHHTFYAPNSAAAIQGLDVPVLDVIGLDNFSPPHPIDLKKLSPGEKPSTTGSGPGGLFIGKDYRAAYAPGVALDGTGQTVGLFEFGPYWANDIKTYEDEAGLPHPKITNVLLDGFTGNPGVNEDVGEESLDIENAIAMAPGASFIVYEGNSAVDILSRIASDNKAKQISCSFGWYPPSSTENQLYQQLVSQGQAFFVASGDGGAYGDTIQIFSPTDNPNIICVGGTYLSTNDAGGIWTSETGWNGSGGGISRTFIIPYYQKGVSNSANQASVRYRNFPDVAATAAFQFYFVYNNGSKGGIGGTSGAAPLWAGFNALINQQAVTNGKPVVGFINPAIYSIGKGTSFNYYPDFHDVTLGNNFNRSSVNAFSATSGYDLVTGWGTPNGIYTINAVAGITKPDFAISSAQANLEVNQGSQNEFTITVTPLNGFNGSINFTASNLPSGVTVSSASSNSSTSITLTADYSASTGTNTIIISGTSDSLSHSIPINLTINAAPTATAQINLTQYFNRTGIVADSSKFSGGLDGVGNAFSGNLLGTSVNWDNTSFIIGHPGESDVVSANGQNIIVSPLGNYAELRMLTSSVNGNQTSQKFLIVYTDTTIAVSQNFSDWFSPANFSNENIAVAMPYRDRADGTIDNRTFYVYGYPIKLDPKRTVRSIILPGNQNLEILSMTLAAPLADTTSIVNEFRLDQNYPNPFNLSTLIRYNLPVNSIVSLKVYDILGREVESLVNGLQAAGLHIIELNGNTLASGVYFYRLEAGPFINTKKLVLVK